MEIENIPAWYISLEGKGEKRAKNAVRVIKNLGFTNIKKFNGIDGNEIDDYILKRIVSPRAYHELEYGRYSHQALSGKGSIGCYLSHMELWKKCIEESKNPSDSGNHEVISATDSAIAIFEDDVNTSDDGSLHLKKGWDSLHTDSEIGDTWNIFRIVYCINPDTYREGKIINDVISKDSYIQGLSGYILSKKGALELLREAFPINEHVDYYINDRLAKLSDSGHYSLLPQINRDLGYKSHVKHNKILRYGFCLEPKLLWFIGMIILIIWILKITAMLYF